MKLHYSQTLLQLIGCWDIVLLPYEITLLSNSCGCAHKEMTVLLPYEITLLSNEIEDLSEYYKVLLPYEITLLSNS